MSYATTNAPWQQTTDNNMPAQRRDGKVRNHLDTATAGALVKDENHPAVKVCRKTQPERIFREFREALNQ